MNEKWNEIPIGGLIVEAGNAKNYHTSGWRATRPIYNPENCSQCFRCWIYCPDSAIMVEDSKVVDIDYETTKNTKENIGVMEWQRTGTKNFPNTLNPILQSPHDLFVGI